MKAAKEDEGAPFYFARGLSDDHLLAPDAVCFPIRLKSISTRKATPDQPALFGEENEGKITANLSDKARVYLTELGIVDLDADANKAGLIWLHTLAVGYSPAYLSENVDGIQGNWPRVPLPNDSGLLHNSAALGRKVSALLDTEKGVAGITSSTIRPEIRVIGVPTGNTQNRAITVGWGHPGKDGITMPGRGRQVNREYHPTEWASIEAGITAQNLTLDAARQRLGSTTCDIYLNDTTYWENIPIKVWEYTIGSYQVIKKWLSYREQGLLRRPLSSDEVLEVTNMARRIAAILLLEPQLDANYRAVKQAVYSWPK